MGLNKKVLYFIDEHGTAGEPHFALGAVMVWARECGKADKAFSDLLPSSANEVHASKWEAHSLQHLLTRFQQTGVPASLILMNKACGSLHGDRPQIYAHALIDTVKTAINRFQKAQRIRNIGNVEVITDLNAQNAHAQFRQVIDAAMNADGRFKAVNSVSPIDSSASRMLQLADIVAHSRSWLKKPDTDAKRLREVFGIEIV